MARESFTVQHDGFDYEVTANVYRDSDGSGREWIAVEDICGEDLPVLTEAMELSMASQIAEQYDSQPYHDPRD